MKGFVRKVVLYKNNKFDVMEILVINGNKIFTHKKKCISTIREREGNEREKKRGKKVRGKTLSV